jgi:uncharacterized small protein (DUF1192 family)
MDLAEHKRLAAQTLGAYCLPGPEMLMLIKDVERLRAEIERLRAESAEKGRWSAEWHGRFVVAEAEIERLRALLNDKTYIQAKADYNRGHLSYCNYLNEKERGE